VGPPAGRREHEVHHRAGPGGEINTQMQTYVLNRVAMALNDHGKPIKGSNICVLGVAYKKKRRRSARVPGIHDPGGARGPRGGRELPRPVHSGAPPRWRHHAIRLASRALTAEFLRDQDAVANRHRPRRGRLRVRRGKQPAGRGHAQRHPPGWQVPIAKSSKPDWCRPTPTTLIPTPRGGIIGKSTILP